MEISDQKRNELTLRVQSVIRTEFNGPKSELRPFRDRLNFACPYCGDSTDIHKKRANIYWKNLMYHCFNDGCQKHTNLVSFLKDFDVPIANKDDLGFFLDYIRANKVNFATKEYLEIDVFSSIKEYSIPIEILKNKLRLLHPSENMKIEKYLKARFMHSRLDDFLYDPKKDQLYILNLTPDRTLVTGWQIRNFGEGKTKYVSFNIEKINYLILDRKIEKSEDDIAKMNTMSLYFGIMSTDFTKPVTIFEGPIDSFLVRNSIAITGIDKPTEMFDDIVSIRYLFDNDGPGIKSMEYKLKKKKKVFMWNKLHKDYKIQPRLAQMKSVKDLSDLFTYCWRTKNEAIKNVDKYFTDNPLDIRSI